MSCHFLFENHKSKLQVGRAWILACSFWFWPLSQLFDRLLCFLHQFQEPLSGGLFGLWMCKWKTWSCLSTKQSDSSANCQPPGVYGHRTNSLLEQTVLMLSTLQTWKNRNHLTKLLKKGNSSRKPKPSLLSQDSFIYKKLHIVKTVCGSFFSQKNPAGHWMSLLLQKNTPESSQMRQRIRWGVTPTWKWPFLPG